MIRSIKIALAISLLASDAYAATTANNFITPQTPNRGYAGLISTTSLNTYLTVYTAGANGSRCYSITVTSTDSVGHNISIQVQNSGNIIYQLTQLVGIAAGQPPVSGGGPVVPFLTPSLTAGLPVDQYGNQYIQLVSGDTIKAAVTYGAISAGQVVDVYAICSDY